MFLSIQTNSGKLSVGGSFPAVTYSLPARESPVPKNKEKINPCKKNQQISSLKSFVRLTFYGCHKCQQFHLTKFILKIMGGRIITK